MFEELSIEEKEILFKAMYAYISSLCEYRDKANGPIARLVYERDLLVADVLVSKMEN